MSPWCILPAVVGDACSQTSWHCQCFQSSKEKENLQEDGPSAQGLVCFHPKAVGHMKRTNIKETLLITPTEIFISTGWHNFLSPSLSPFLRKNKLPQFTSLPPSPLPNSLLLLFHASNLECIMNFQPACHDSHLSNNQHSWKFCASQQMDRKNLSN